MMRPKSKYKAPKEYRILYRHKGEVSEQYHYYNCYSVEEALKTFKQVAEQRNWDDLKIVHVEEFDRFHGTWKILSEIEKDTKQGFPADMDFGTTME